MWPFKKKLIENPSPSLPAQVEMVVKSLSLPESQPNWSLYAHHNKDWDVQKAIWEGYDASSIVYACVEKRAQLIASVPWKAQTLKGGEWEDAPQHPLQLLINKPNLDQSWYELIYSASQNIDLAGSAFMSEIRAGIKDLPQELWVLPSQYIKIKPGKKRLIDYFEHTQCNEKIQADDMIHLKKPNPNSSVWGMPILMAAAKPTDIDRESGIWQKVSLENRGASDINIKLPDTATKEQADSVREQYNKQQAGPKNARKALMTSADVQMLNQTAVELDFVSSRRAVWTEICAAFGMSLANLGMTEDVNLANADAMNKALWENTIIPQLDLLQPQFNRQLAADYGDDVRMVYDITNVKALQTKITEKLEAAGKLHALGVPMADINKKLELGLEDRPEYAVGYIASGLVPSSFDLDEPEGSPEDENKGAYGKV